MPKVTIRTTMPNVTVTDSDGTVVALDKAVYDALQDRHKARWTGKCLFLGDYTDDTAPVSMGSATVIALVTDALTELVRRVRRGAHVMPVTVNEVAGWCVVGQDHMPVGEPEPTEFQAWHSAYECATRFDQEWKRLHGKRKESP